VKYPATRRDLFREVTCVGLLGLSSRRAQSYSPERPFCRFSLLDGWTATGPAEYITRQAGPTDESGVPQVINRIRASLSIRPKIEVFIAKDEDNAFATVAGGRKILVADVGFLEKINQIAGTEWAAIQVLAHEVGHHIAGFISDRHRCELNADYWSGQVLQRLGSDRNAAVKAIMSVGTETDSSTHPNKYRRASTIKRGWDDADNNTFDYSFCDQCS